MSLHFILDGYNIIKKIPKFSSKTLKDKRLNLLRLIEEKRLAGSSKNKVTIVFDGDSDDLTMKKESSFKIIFTKDADQKIKDMVGKLDNPKNVVVVTDDREIKFSVRLLGVKVKSCEEFLEKADPAPSRRCPAKEDLKLEISLKEQEKITEELKNIWLTRIN